MLLLSAAFPVSRDGETIGVVGVDFDLSALSEHFAGIKPYGDGMVCLVSHDLMWAATSDESQLGEPVAPAADFWPASATGPGIPQDVTIVRGENGLLHLLSPIHLRQFDQPWMVVISVPEATVMADAIQIRQLVLYTGVGLVVCVILALLAVSHLLVRQPIHRSIEAIQALEAGQLATPIPETKRRDEIGDINRALLSFRDSLNQVQELEAADRAKSQFLANMSHEIRTPLNGVLAASQMLDKTELSEDQAEYLRIIRSSGAMLFDLIRDVLDLSKIESGQIRLASDEFRLTDVIQRSADAVGAMATGKGLDMRVEISPELDCSFRGDETRVCQIVTNLAGNAVKFTDTGHVAIHVYRAGKSGQVWTRVEDTGPGIAKANLVRVFDRFSQIDESDTREFGGSGLGLAISRQFARLMGGDISARSKPGVGSCFTVLLPR
ncbi:ATP-binding protein [Maricaulis sp.]|uniref:sensor histidine kinase n=1 Tax=Maricaulis sp. TaxID=1486257 RepID=UPI001AFF5F01|nr:ATP-binding protein [Maricaulis sp.]MBO6798485.1 HAMP domain-containing protein [Maricaulis sp.]